jgi:hypothetical protein
MNINDIYKLVSYLVDKYQGTYLSPDDFNMAINMAQRQYLNFLTEETLETTGRGPGQQQFVTRGSLSGFLKESTLTISSQLATYPSDYYKISAMRTTNDDFLIRKVGADKLYAYINNPIDTPTLTEPIYTEIGSNFKFFPNTLTSAKIIYFKQPVDAAWVPLTGTLTYNPSASTQLEWPDNDLNDIIYRTIGIIGINLKDGDLVRASLTVKNDGQ